jgi:hypothetical protein
MNNLVLFLNGLLTMIGLIIVIISFGVDEVSKNDSLLCLIIWGYVLLNFINNIKNIKNNDTGSDGF